MKKKIAEWKLGLLLIMSIIMDFLVEPALSFSAILCALPSISGIGIGITFSCWIAAIGSVAIFGAYSIWLLGKNIGLNVATATMVAEAIPALNLLPLFTVSSMIYIIQHYRKK